MAKPGRKKPEKRILPVHHSRVVPTWKPLDMVRERYPDNDTRLAIERTAIDIFTDCTNAGVTFQGSLAAVLNSGMHFVVDMQKEQDTPSNFSSAPYYPF